MPRPPLPYVPFPLSFSPFSPPSFLFFPPDSRSNVRRGQCLRGWAPCRFFSSFLLPFPFFFFFQKKSLRPVSIGSLFLSYLPPSFFFPSFPFFILFFSLPFCEEIINEILERFQVVDVLLFLFSSKGRGANRLRLHFSPSLFFGREGG